MNKEKQTVKRRIFISNTRMVLVTLSLFLFINIFVVNIYENKNSMSDSSELADNTEQIRNILTDWNPSPKEEAINNLATKLDRYGFSVCFEIDNEVIYSNTDFPVSEIINEIGDYLETDGKVHIYVQDYMTVLAQNYMDEKMKVFAIAGEYNKFWSLNNRFTTILLLIDGVFCIGALLIISQIFTKRLIKHITNPLDALSEGAKRMKEGDFSEPVKYKGDIEFEYVCDAFNEMQEHITKANAEKKSYEKVRVEMVAGISHDLRTPLTAIRGTIKGLKDGVATTPELRETFLDTAYRRTIEMDWLLERLFYFSKLETGNMPLFFEKTEWSDYLEAYVKRYESLIENESIKIKIIDVKKGLFSNVDRDQMKRILDNILENSKKYAEADKLEITINIFEEHAYVVLEISDNGCGVSEDKISHIFEQFFRGDESRNIKEGNGLGLYIVKYLVNAMGGSVEAENSNGLTIRIRLPILDE